MQIKVLDRDLYSAEVERGSFEPRYPGDAGVDLRSRIDVRVHAGETEKIPLGVAVDIPTGYVGWMTGRSTTCLEFGLLTHEGKIDSGYRGEIHTFVTALGSPVALRRGERISQLVVVSIDTPPFVVVQELTETSRGDLGLGSSGKL